MNPIFRRGEFVKKVALSVLLSLLAGHAAAEWDELTPDQAENAAAQYQQYCALCHGDDRQGHVNDHAPSLKSKSLMASGFPWAVMYATGYGRAGTPMAPFFDEVGGPLSREEIWNLGLWLRQQVDVEAVELPLEPVAGDTELGATVYQNHCAECHGTEGEGVTGTALGNPGMLAFTIDEFLKYAIVNGRDGTDMQAFRDILRDGPSSGLSTLSRRQPRTTFSIRMVNILTSS